MKRLQVFPESVLVCLMLLAGACAAAGAEVPPPPAEGGEPHGVEAPAERPGDPEPPSPSRQVLDEGWGALRRANYPLAEEKFEQVSQETSEKSLLAEALYGLALTYQVRRPGGDAQVSAALFERLLKDFGDTSAAPYATLSLARLADLPENEKDRTEEKIEKARELYRSVLEKWPDHLAADEAALRLGQTYLENVGETAAEDKGEAVLQARLKARPENALAAPMHLLLGNFYYRREAYSRAVKHWIAADGAGIPGLTDKATVYFHIGSVAEHRLKDYRLAAKWYMKIVTDVERDNKYYVALQSAKRCRRLASETARAEEQQP